MISVDEALRHVLDHSFPLASTSLELSAALGRTLAADVTSDIDSPPHDKSLVDGYALRTSDLGGANTQFKVLEEVTAGEMPSCKVTSDSVTRIMTGAAIPEGADAVVMLEETEARDAGTVLIRRSALPAGSNIMRRGTSLCRGDTVLEAGATIRPLEVGLLSEVGRSQVLVQEVPRVAIVATGNELVPSDHRPESGQIRNSNGPMLTALVRNSGAGAVDLGIGRDDHDILEQLVTEGLQSDVLILSGGVSAGVLDLVPGVLKAAGVKQVFHKVNLKPGKPLWFGVSSPQGQTLVFGLPGNPVSGFVCFELFVRPALDRLAGRTSSTAVRRRFRLACDHTHRGARPTYYPAAWEESVDDQPATAKPLAWRGSADLRSLTACNCLLVLPSGDYTLGAGQWVDGLVI